MVWSLLRSPSKMADTKVNKDDCEKKYLYLYAEFENFKKRVAQERSELLKFALKPVACELLDVMDSLEFALRQSGGNQSLADGLQLTLKQLKAVLQKQGVDVIKSVGCIFDPEYHESVGQEASETPIGTVLKEEQTGYTLHGRLLRPARVIISSGIVNQAA